MPPLFKVSRMEALRGTDEASKDSEGRTRYKGNPTKHWKGVPCLVDCVLTGSDRGTPANPKFALRDLLGCALIPPIEELVRAG